MKKYIVGLSTGGLMESPQITYDRFQVIETETPEEAKDKYDEINNCSYFYGVTLCEYNDRTSHLLKSISITDETLELLRNTLPEYAICSIR